MRLVPALASAIFLAALTSYASPQQLIASLPDSPGFQQAQPPADAPQTPASLSGLIRDLNGTPIPAAQITLTSPGKPFRTVESDPDGAFLFPNLPAATYTLTVASPNMEPLTLPSLHLLPGQQHALPPIILRVAATTSSVQVIATQDQIATEQVHMEEQQRILLIFPNFYSSYLWNAAPLKTHNKFNLAVHSLTDPLVIVSTAFLAGIQQANNTYPGYGQGAEGYAKRLGADYADHATDRMLSSAVFPTLFHQDPRYFYMGPAHTGKERLRYAIDSAVLCRGDNGKRQVNFSHILGAFASGALSATYHTSSDRSAGLVLGNAFLQIAAGAGNNIVREFLFRQNSSNVPGYATGKPADPKPAP